MALYGFPNKELHMTLYTKQVTELPGAFEIREATLEDYKQLIPDNIKLELAKDYLYESKIKTEPLTSPELTKLYLSTKVVQEEQEVFGVMFLNNENQVIHEEIMFKGTIDAVSVYPREVVKAALKHNAVSSIFYHNHPSGVAEPSQADRRITRRLVDALGLVDIRVLDHFVVGMGEVVSFAERGWI